jgi:hypothetical protein
VHTQPVPVVTEADLRRVLERDFPGEGAAKAAGVLAAYGREAWHREPVRVKLAVLKLANRDLAKLEQLTAAAATDYRDVLAWAEYPAYFATPVRAPERERDAAIESDWAQYQQWLREP